VGKAIEQVSFIKGRLRRLEGRMQGGRYRECGLTSDEPGRIVLIDDGTPAEGFPDDPEERCSRCGRYLWCVIRFVYDDAEGGGAKL
jgi:hypothetical protein